MNSVIVAITGASGAVYGVQALLLLRELNLTTHLIISNPGILTIKNEEIYIKQLLKTTTNLLEDIKKLASYSYRINDISASISSGSFKVDGMIIAPCSSKTLAGISLNYEDNLITRAAGVSLKERRPLIVMFRESPYTLAHLNHMTEISRMGGVIVPTSTAFYNKPSSLLESVRYSTARALDLLKLDVECQRWQGEL